MPIFSPEEEERDDLLNSISISFFPQKTDKLMCFLKIDISSVYLLFRLFQSGSLDFPTKPLSVCDAA